MERGARLPLLIGIAAAILGMRALGADGFDGREAALRRAFGPEARFEPRTVYWTPQHVDSVRVLGRVPIVSPRFTYWRAVRGDSLLGIAFFDTGPVRTMPATWFVAVSPAGDVLALDVVAFHEPEDYRPPRRWLDRLRGKRLADRLQPGAGVDAIAGATLSARAACEAIRRSLASARVLEGFPR